MFLFLILFICSFLNLTSLDLIPLNHLGIRRELCAFGLTSSLVLNGGSFALEIFITLAVYLFLHYYYSYYWPSTHLYIYIFIVCFTNLYYYLFVVTHTTCFDRFNYIHIIIIWYYLYYFMFCYNYHYW